MRVDRVDRLVLLCFVATAVAVVGMVFDYWQLVYYAIPVLTALFLFMAALDRRDAWSTPVLAGVAAFGGVLLALFVAGNVLLHTDGWIGGLPAATAVFLYAVWPVTTVAAPLLYAWVYHTWLRHDVEDAEPESAA
ncbi:hypothetical protein [Prauserella muralis]|uniref:Uncharacterized protein n=1 Tax=Prauserella muralis TaxID=588067 RepID=A0A2V4B176_9PSEU|nr:hypothetical protein [Prauserella muralis]PXY27793.1 hypothetical protein BAY60_15575 [Prauserella muralis]TWE22449.1 hypothetical protein FHX69_3688 [Prauserella muralis]